jgi:hypothetical protein
LIVPALRSNVANPEQFLESYEIGVGTRINSNQRQEIISFYDGYLNGAVKWESGSTIQQFKAFLLTALRNTDSVLYTNLKSPGRLRLGELIEKIEREQNTTRYELHKYIRSWDAHNKKVLKIMRISSTTVLAHI